MEVRVYVSEEANRKLSNWLRNQSPRILKRDALDLAIEEFTKPVCEECLSKSEVLTDSGLCSDCQDDLSAHQAELIDQYRSDAGCL